MDLTRYVDELRHELQVAAEAGGEEAAQLAERLVAPLQSATRLVLLDALSVAAGEITADLAPGSVEVRLRGRDPEFVVTSPVADLAEADHDTPTIDHGYESDRASAAGASAPYGDEGGTSRVTLRIPDSLKLRIDDAAASQGLSVNAWLVRTLSGVVEPTGPRARSVRRSSNGGERFTGWARS